MKRATGSMLLLLSVVWLARPCSVTAQPAGAPDATAQSTSGGDPLAPVSSLGKPPVWKPFAGGYYGLDSTEDETKNGGGAYFGVYKDLLPSIVGIGVSAEGYLGGYSGVSGVNGGVRALLELRGLYLKAGVDYDVQHDDTSFILSLTLPLRRGGILGHGTHFRVDWLPGPRQLLELRPADPARAAHGEDAAPPHGLPRLPRATKPAAPRPGPAGEAAMGEVRKAARKVMILNTMFWRDHRSDRLKSLETSRAEMREFKSPDQPDGRAPPARHAHGERGPDPPRPASTSPSGSPPGPRRRTRERRAPRSPHSRARSCWTRSSIRTTACSGSTRSPRSSGASRRGRGSASQRGSPGSQLPDAGADAVRLLFDECLQALENLRAWGLKQSLGRLARDVDPAPARAAARAVRHAAGARRHRLPRAGHAARRRQPGLLLERPAVAADAAPQHPRGARLPRALAPRLRRQWTTAATPTRSATTSRSRAT